jgi:GTP-binding protein
MTKMVNHGSGRVRLEFHVPSRGLIGLRSEMLTDTGHRDHELAVPGLHRVAGRDPHRAHRVAHGRPPGRATGYAIFNLQERGEMFITPAPRFTRA